MIANRWSARRGADPGLGDPSRVAITFDDGPDPASTPQVLALLEALDVRATFFVLGAMLEQHPDAGRSLVSAGHEVGVHGWSHRPLPLRGPASTRADLARAHAQVEATCGVTPTRYRPPYGVLTRAADRAARELGMTPVLWTTWGRDWRRAATGASVRADVTRHLGPGGTVLLHDSDCTSAPEAWRSTLAALPGIVGDVRALGLVPGPLRDHGLPARSPRNPGRG